MIRDLRTQYRGYGVRIAKLFLKKSPSSYVQEDREQQRFNQLLAVFFLLVAWVMTSLIKSRVKPNSPTIWIRCRFRFLFYFAVILSSNTKTDMAISSSTLISEKRCSSRESM
ncbi:hypothetical protein NSS94_16660 [Paenibacillus sp. FSL L8-0644]|uniref:hypothetical protein n=1 Tax=Paenibacillus sp. FSL H7-0442 TaxID=2921435 RepID=UPI0030F55ACE